MKEAAEGQSDTAPKRLAFAGGHAHGQASGAPVNPLGRFEQMSGSPDGHRDLRAASLPLRSFVPSLAGSSGRNLRGRFVLTLRGRETKCSKIRNSQTEIDLQNLLAELQARAARRDLAVADGAT